MPPIISVAPMMDCTDRHDRFFLRLIAPDIQLYTEMITTYALMHGDVQYLLGFDAREKYVALQLGGSDPKHLAHCARLGEEFGYDEINLNTGCPSPRVSSGRFGACLMREPDLVADCVAAMHAAVNIPVTVKCRIGVDNEDSYEALTNYIKTVAAAGCQTFIIHARKAWLSGLSPKQNRDIPPLRYDVVHQIKRDFPQLTIILNGGIKSLDTIEKELSFVDGAMIGREAYANPYFLALIQAKFYPDTTLLSRHAVIEALFPYVYKELKMGLKLHSITRHLVGLFHGLPGASAWRRHLSVHACKKGAGIEVLEQALSCVKQR